MNEIYLFFVFLSVLCGLHRNRGNGAHPPPVTR
jgi:hypothetical protein